MYFVNSFKGTIRLFHHNLESLSIGYYTDLGDSEIGPLVLSKRTKLSSPEFLLPCLWIYFAA